MVPVFCPQCGHQQVSNETRFCSACGLSLGLVTDLLPGTRNQLQRERRELTGAGLMMATVLMLLNFLFVFGVITLPHLANPVFLWIWLGFVISSLVVGGFGLANLIRGGFFKRLKERETQLRLMKAEQDRQALAEQTLAEETKSVRGASGAPPLLSGAASVTEMTTRELDRIPQANKREQKPSSVERPQ